MSNEEKYLQRIEALEADVALLKLAVKDLEREVTQPKASRRASSELSELQDEVLILKTVVAQHSRDIEALKSAQ